MWFNLLIKTVVNKFDSHVPAITSSVGTVLIFQFSPGFGTEASVPAVLRYWFWFLLLSTRVSVQGFQRVIYIFLISVLVRFHFGSISAPNQVEPKALVLELKLTGT